AALVVAGTAVLVAATGWLEDLAARRSPVLWPSLPDAATATGAGPGRRARWRPALVPAMALAVVVVLVPVAASGPTMGVDTFALRVPSQAPPPPVVDDAVVVAHGTRPLRLDPDGLDRLVAGWADDAGVDGAVLAVSTPEGGTWSGAVG